MSSESLHEPRAQLSEEALDRHRAITSLMEEMEAVDWYDQRVQATTNAELKSVLAHNRDEEKEHAAMVLEWLRRNDATIAEQLRTYLFAEGPITEQEEAATGEATDAAGAADSEPAAAESEPAVATNNDNSLRIGSLKGRP